MELALSMGEPPARPLTPEIVAAGGSGRKQCTAFKPGRLCIGHAVNDLGCEGEEEEENRGSERGLETEERLRSVDPPVQLNLLPLETLHRLDKAKHRNLEVSMRMVNAELGLPKEEAEEGAAMSSSPNTAYSFQMEDVAGGVEVVAAEAAVAANAGRETWLKGSDVEENGGPRKKLRLSKEQSAFLEKSFKEHNTLSARQKLALAKQLNLRPRQVEVWFQNRRARTKLKQTEVDCDYLKRRCQTLREENRRLQKELAALRAFRSSQPVCMQPHSEAHSQRVSSISAATASTSSADASGNPSTAFLFPNSRFYSFAGPPLPAPPYQPSATS